MDPILVATLGTVGMFLLIVLHVPLGVAMGVAGLAGFAVLGGTMPALSLLASETASTFSSLDLATIPLFILMGGFAGAAGLSEDLYRLAYAFVGHRRGGLAIATIGGSAGFGAVCGSSIATTATFGRIALPSMLSRKYEPGFAAGTVAGGGTLGILVPPSVIMVIYAVLAQELIITLYVAAIIPSILAVTLHVVAILVYVRVRGNAAPAGPRVSWNERLTVMRQSWAAIVLILVVLGGISFGIFTANEAAAVGAALAFMCALLRRALTKKVLEETLMDSASTTAMIYIIIIGAALFGYFVAVTQAPQAMVSLIRNSGLPVPLILIMMMGVYLVLGAVFDEVAVMVITLPFVLPIITSWGYDPIWWGIINIALVELGMLIPPIGMNVFVIYSIAKTVPLTQIYRGVTPYVLSNIVRLSLLLWLPALSLWLPKLLKGE
jgi:C4-dicarboxylate transporter, DctM subunit